MDGKENLRSNIWILNLLVIIKTIYIHFRKFGNTENVPSVGLTSRVASWLLSSSAFSIFHSSTAWSMLFSRPDWTKKQNLKLKGRKQRQTTFASKDYVLGLHQIRSVLRPSALMATPYGSGYHSQLLPRRRSLGDITWLIQGHVTSWTKKKSC